MITINKLVAVAPFETTQNRIKVEKGLSYLTAKTELSQLKVVLRTDDNEFEPGDTIFVKGETRKHTYASEIFEVDGVSFILIPYNLVLGVTRKPVIPAPRYTEIQTSTGVDRIVDPFDLVPPKDMP